MKPRASVVHALRNSEELLGIDQLVLLAPRNNENISELSENYPNV